MINVYIASCDKDGGIYRFAMNSDGTLAFLDKADIATPSYLAIDADKLHVTLRAPYDGSGESAYTCFDIGSSGELLNMGAIIDADGVSACYLSVVGGAVYTTNYVTGSIKRFPDKLLKKSGGSNVKPDRQASSHPHCIIPTPDGKCLAVTDLGCDTVTVYDRELNEISLTSTLPGAGPRHITFSPDGALAYVINELMPYTTVYRYGDGKFERLGEYPVLPYSFFGKFNGEGAGSAIRCVGDYLYVGIREENKITCYRRVADRLEYLFSSDTGGDHPRDFNIYGDILISANMVGNNVSVFRIDEGRGLTKIQSLEIKTPTCVVFKEK